MKQKLLVACVEVCFK